MTLTEKQRRVYRFIVAEYDRTGWTPTYAQVAERLGMKSNAVAYGYVTRMAERGFLRQDRQGIHVVQRRRQCFKTDYARLTVAGWPVLQRL